MDEMEFSEAASNIDDLICEYQSCQDSSADINDEEEDTEIWTTNEISSDQKDCKKLLTYIYWLILHIQSSNTLYLYTGLKGYKVMNY